MMETDPGSLLAGKYRVERVLGTGGMGVVVAAIHEQLDERVAIKLLRADRLAQSEAVERALREARATVKIQSEHVVRVFDVGTLETGAPYIVMEYLAGCDLAQLLCAEGRLEIGDAASYVRQACDAVSKAHAIGIVHRDLKPANLFLAVREETSTIKVLDFGISKFIASGTRVDAALTSTASVLGSPAYMSPEQLESPRDIDARTDVWSLGVILFELLTGAHPFVADTLPQLYKRIAEAPAPSLRSIRPDVPADLDAIVARCLAKQPGERFAEVATLADALAPFAVESGKPVSGLVDTAMASREEIESARLASMTSLPRGERGSPAASQTVKKRRSWLFGGAAFAGLAAAATSLMVCERANRNDETAAAEAPAAAPLARGESILACPQLAAQSHGKPAGWLGAAVSTIACTRAQVRMGNRPERTLYPADLLDLPSAPVDHFPEDAFSDLQARDRQLRAAKQRGQAWIDGGVEHTEGQFAITLVLRAGDRELARGTAKDATLMGSLKTAMQPLERWIPAAPDDDAFLREWMGARTAKAATALADWSIAWRLDWPAKSECDQILREPDVLPVARGAITNWCNTDTPVDVAARDTSSAGALAISIEADGLLAKRSHSEELGRLDAMLAKTTEPRGRAILLGMKSSVLSTFRDYPGAMQTAMHAIDQSPKVYFPWSTGWNTLSWVRANSNAAPAAVAWTPWNVEAYCFSAMRDPDVATGARYMQRNVVLSRAPIWRQSLVEFLVDLDRRDDARSVAAKLPDDPTQILLLAADGKFAPAMELAGKLMKSDDPYTASYVAYFASHIHLVTGLPVPGLEQLIDRWLVRDAAKIADNIIVEINFGTICAMAPQALGRKCVQRLRAITGGAMFMDTSFLAGAERFVEQDYAGAAKAWRGYVAQPDWHFHFMHDLLAIAFEGAHDVDNATRIDARYTVQGGRYNGVELAHVREALRAEKRGDLERARALAKKVIDGWSVVDVDVPAVPEMRKLIARLGAPKTAGK